MKWFNFNAIFKEISKIRWPKRGDLFTNSVQVIIFTGFFVLFFAACLAAVSAFMTAMGEL